MPQRVIKNELLSQLPAHDFQLLQPYLAPLELPVRKKLEQPGKAIDHVYFVERGVVSVIVGGPSREIEIGVIGPEGMTGLSVLMGVGRSSYVSIVQIAGTALRIAAGQLEHAIERSASLHRSFLRYAHSFMTQSAQTALANGHSTIEERLARWLLMAHDRVDGDDLPLTHDFLATMLGVRRPGVTVALHHLEKLGLIQTQRGVITIIDRAGLEERANGAYV